MTKPRRHVVAGPADPGPQVDPYRPTNRRRRVLIGLLAVATASTVMWLVLEKPGAPPPRPRVEPAPCAPGQTEGCVGGKAHVIVVPAAASSTPAR
jgi:hypothetical protein